MVKRLLDYQSEWSTDCKIDTTRLDTESSQIPYLHSKYLNYLSNERLSLKRITVKKDKLVETLTDYYTGIIDGKDIGRDPWQIKESKSSSERRVEKDQEVINMNLILYEKEEMVLFLKEVVMNINQRNFQIKNTIDFMKFQNGGY